MADGIELILTDHRRVEALFDAFEAGDSAALGQIVDALTEHDQAEHAALYPLAGHLLGDADGVERWAAAHSAVKRQIDTVKQLEGPGLEIAVATLRQLVTDHVADEEGTLLPALREAATPAQLQGLGARILQVKQRVG